MEPRPRFVLPARSGARHLLLLAAGAAVVAGVAALGLMMQWLSGAGVTFSLPAIVWMATPALLAIAFAGWVVWRVYDERDEPGSLQPADLVGLVGAATAGAALQGLVSWLWPRAPDDVHHTIGGVVVALTALLARRMARETTPRSTRPPSS